VLSSSLLGGDLQAEQLGIAFERSHLEEWLHVVMRREPALAAFSGLEHGAAIQRFRSLDEELIELAGAVLRARLAAELPTVRSTSASSSELGVLLRELKKQRRHLAPRQLFQRIPNLLSRLAPCCLMSPMSVAQVLGPRSEPFDLVVFDEASQVPVWDAVGAIARGRSLVVVGDSKQLPPTTFFQRLDEGDDESVDDGQVEELESVLDECAAAGLRRLSLRWHYRSQHESLIAFSNHHYYDNRLLTFPSPDRDEAGEGPTDRGRLGVRLQMVEGVYDRSRSQTNRVEAECLVRDLVARLSDPSQHDLSFGVVTFSVVQQVLVEDLLDEARRDHPEIEHAFAGCDEPVFVKNLENVQGDERDVMLFSVCYGPDSAGRVHMNFGPLNRQGGERRLNVAITRARRELVVYSSVHADQIELSRTNSIGVRHLRAFLDYCRRGPLVLDEEVVLGRTQAPESPFEREVLAAIESLGHEVHAQVGCSGYRIDLAVVDPRRKGRYLLGVECDGATYHSAATARDRDRLRQAVLERLGWRIERVWSTDWWMDPRAEVRRLADVIERLLREPIAAPPAAPTEPDPSPAIQPAERGPIGLEVESGAATEFERYTACELPRSTDAGAFHATVHSRRLAEQAEQVLASETPIVFDLLARRLCEAWGVGRMTERVRSRVERILQLVDHREHDGALWAPGVDPAGWRGFRASQPGNADREAEQLPSVEIVNAMVWVLEQHGSLSEEDLMREAARVFGITRLGRAVRAVMQHAMRRLLRDGAGILEAGLVRLRPTAEDDD
jgi:very-short-patch-repair endonuclease